MTGHGNWTGTWTRRGNSDIFDGVWIRGSQRVVTEVRVEISGNAIKATRYKSSDGYTCSYTGTLSWDGQTASGTSRCGGGTAYSWNATIRK